MILNIAMKHSTFKLTPLQRICIGFLNCGRSDFVISHPPELGVDFDVVYSDGLRGVGIAETESHPIRVEGPRVTLDGTLRWKFMQSESMHNTVPVTTDRSIFYAYS